MPRLEVGKRVEGEDSAWIPGLFDREAIAANFGCQLDAMLVIQAEPRQLIRSVDRAARAVGVRRRASECDVLYAVRSVGEGRAHQNASGRQRREWSEVLSRSA